MKKIKLSNSDQYALVDDEDYPVLARLRWYISDSGYAVSDSIVKHLKMHKLLIGPIPGQKVIDHIDRNKLNNQKSNLRVVSQKVNMENTDRYQNSKLYYYDVRRKCWTIDSRRHGVRYIVVKNPSEAERIIKRLDLGFPKDLAIKEANEPTISITNWKKHNIRYDDYVKAKELGIDIKVMRRRSKRGKAKAKED